MIGGGPAGLAAATALVRFGRAVEVVDAGAPRNAPAAQVHNVLGHDGLAPGVLLDCGRAELARYGGRLVAGTAVGAEGEHGRFTVTLASGNRRTARRLIVTTGVRDVLPAVPGLADRWGRDVLHCPYCHGFEVRGCAIGVLATGPAAIRQTLLFRELTDHLMLFTHVAAPWSNEQLEQLAALQVEVVDGLVADLHIADDVLTGVRLANGPTVGLQALVVAPTTDATSPVLDALGAPLSDNGVGGYAHDMLGATPVPGVWVAGNAADPYAPVLVAAAAGLTAGSAVNADLVDERVREAVAAHRTATSRSLQAVGH